MHTLFSFLRIENRYSFSHYPFSYPFRGIRLVSFQGKQALIPLWILVSFVLRIQTRDNGLLKSPILKEGKRAFCAAIISLGQRDNGSFKIFYFKIWEKRYPFFCAPIISLGQRDTENMPFRVVLFSFVCIPFIFCFPQKTGFLSFIIPLKRNAQ